MGGRQSIAGHHNSVRVIGDVARVNRWVGGTVKGLLVLVQAGPEPSLIAVAPGHAELPKAVKEGDRLEVRGRLMSYQLSRRELMLAVEADWAELVYLKIQGENYGAEYERLCTEDPPAIREVAAAD